MKSGEESVPLGTRYR